jgi:hypothetical protein
MILWVWWLIVLVIWFGGLVFGIDSGSWMDEQSI